jgi:hypothetical protein
MIAKAKAISHGRQAINYVLRDGKLGTMLASNLIESLTPDEILKEFEMMQRYNTRCRNKFLRFEIGIAPQDEAKLKRADLQIICREFAKSMGLTDYQWFAATHKDTDNLHIHLIANRINIDDAVYQTDFVSNRAAKAAEELSRKMDLTIANEVRKQKQHEKRQMSPERYEIKKRLQDIAYKEFRNPNNKTAKSFIDALKCQGVTVEPVRNKQNKIYGIRFQFEGQTFKASEIGKEFGLRSLFLHYGQNIDGCTTTPKHFEKAQASPLPEQNQSTAGIIGALLDLPLPTSDYDADEAALQRQTQKKKKKRRGMRW